MGVVSIFYGRAFTYYVTHLGEGKWDIRGCGTVIKLKKSISSDMFAVSR